MLMNIKFAGKARRMVGTLLPVFLISVCWLGSAPALSGAAPDAQPLVFPFPQEMERPPESFPLKEMTTVLVPEYASENDLYLARFLVAELSDRYQLAVSVKRGSRIPTDEPVIVMGSIDNPLVRQYCRENKLKIDAETPGPEGYLLRVGRRRIVIAGSDQRGAFYGLQSLRQLIYRTKEGVRVHGVRIRDWPHTKFRAIRLYLPGHENITFFERFLRNFMALYKYNKVIIEMNAAMRLDRHPELNAGWMEFAKSLNYTRRSRTHGPRMQAQDSAHYDTADGGILEKKEVAGIVDYARRLYIDVIPELPTLTHSYYWLTRHRELAAIPTAEWPDTYCPQNPGTYKLVFDVFDEYINVMKPKIISIGHDEYRIPVAEVPPACRGNWGDIYGKDVKTLHDYLAVKGIKTAMWGDMLMERNRGKGLRQWTTPNGYTYDTPGALTPAQVEKWIPKDVLIFNWFWQEGGRFGRGEINELDFARWGFHQVYANFRPDIKNYERRSTRASVLGGFPSSWAATTEFNFGKDLMYSFLGCANRLWASRWPKTGRLYRIAQALMPEVYQNLSAGTLPSEDGDPVAPLDISSHFSAETAGADLSAMRTGEIRSGHKVFNLASEPGRVVVVGTVGKKKSSLPTAVNGIHVGVDPSSLIFLQAAARPADNSFAYRRIYDFADTADLLGWYEVVYEDGYVLTIPIRYGVNILEWNWARRNGPRSLAYQTEMVNVSKKGHDPISLFAFEWKNPRFGKVIKEINLKGTTGFKNYKGEAIPDNAVILAAVSFVKRREAPSAAKPLAAGP